MQIERRAEDSPQAREVLQQIGHLLGGQVAEQELGHERSRLRDKPLDVGGSNFENLALSVLEHHSVVVLLHGDSVHDPAVFGLEKVSGVRRLDCL